MVHVSPATHKMVRHRVATKRLADWVELGMRRKRRVTRLTASCRLLPGRHDTAAWWGLGRQGGTVCQTVAKLLCAIEGKTESFSKERDMSHLTPGTNHTLAVEMENRSRNIQEGSTACALHERGRLVSNKIHHDG